MQKRIAINLGVDFGTRYTKICARTEEIGACVVDFGGSGVNGALTPSVVSVTPSGRLSVPEPGTEEPEGGYVGYLKMALADRGQLGIHVDRVLLKEPPEALVEPLSAFFLAKVIERAKQWVLSEWREHIGRRDVIWSANVGLPVEYVDSDIAPRFQQVLAVAWAWAEENLTPASASDLTERYAQTSAKLLPDMSYCQTYPEIAAAVLSFGTSRSAAPGIYVYFDVGGGTVDGVIFNLLRPAGGVRINFYAGQVEPLGVDWIAEEICRRGRDRGGRGADLAITKVELLRPKLRQIPAKFAEYADQISKLTGGVVYKGKLKDRRNWRAENIQSTAGTRTLRRSFDDANVKPLKVFVGGGGIGASFYLMSIANGYERNTLRNYNVPPFELIEVPHPPDLALGSVAHTDFHRFLVAYGLSTPYGEGPEIGLPSQFSVLRPRQEEREPVVPDYLDQRDIYD